MLTQPKKSPTRKPPPHAALVTIERIGAEGDGIGRFPDGTPAYVPLTLPPEVATADPPRPRGDGWLARAGAIETPSESRGRPPCPQFGHCGGCVLQHWRDSPYQNWKSG